MYSYRILNENLIIEEIETRIVKWIGKPYNCPVIEAIPINNQTACIVLLDDYEFSLTQYRSKGNLLLIDPNGEIKWHAEVPETSDSYVDIKLVDQKISAHSWGCFWVSIDINNGKIIDKVFTK